MWSEGGRDRVVARLLGRVGRGVHLRELGTGVRVVVEGQGLRVERGVAARGGMVRARSVDGRMGVRGREGRGAIGARVSPIGL